MSIILMTTLFYKALILEREIWHWSLLGLKGLRVEQEAALGRLSVRATFPKDMLNSRFFFELSEGIFKDQKEKFLP